MFVNDAFLESSREPSLVDDCEEDNRPVAQLPLSIAPLKNKRKGKRGNEQCARCPCSTLTENPGFTYFQVLMNRPLDSNTGLQPVFSMTVDDPQKVGSPIGAYTMYTVHTRVSTSPP